MNKKFDFAISGAGSVGSAVALGLRRRGFDVALFDARLKQPVDTQFTGRAFALSLPSKQFLADLGVWDQLASCATWVAQMHITQGQVGQPAQSAFDLVAQEKGQEALAYMMEERDLLAALRAALLAAGVTMLPDAIENFDQDASGVRVYAHGQAFEAQHFIIAEGKQSANAQRAGFAPQIYEYDQMGIVCALQAEVDHASIAYQNFFPNGPFAVLPLQDGRLSLVWSDKSDVAQEVLALDPAAFLGVIRARMGNVLGRLDLLTTPRAFPLYLAAPFELSLRRITALGDSAHQVHPLAGQGLNLGLEDAMGFMKAAQRSHSLGLGIGASSAFDEWSKDRARHISAMAHGLSGINFLFSNDNPVLRHLRGAGMMVFKNNKRLRQWAMAFV